MARRRAGRSHDELPDLSGAQAGRLPEQWSTIPAAELHHRHQQAALLVARGHGAITWAELLGER
jgi:hypothetical protein